MSSITSSKKINESVHSSNTCTSSLNTNAVTEIEVASDLHGIPNKSFQRDVAPQECTIHDELIDDDKKQMNKFNINKKQIKDEPLIKVIFQNQNIASQYRETFKDFLQNLLSVTLSEERLKCTDLILEIKNTDLNSINDSNDIEISDAPLFMIDSTPAHHDTLNVPIYGKKFEQVLTKTHDNRPEEISCNISKLNCFNCLGNHNLRDCTEPKNHFAINKNRKEFTNKIKQKHLRYRLNQKFEPGIISSELKKALGIGNDELPKHIYKMRLLGYPPGWLEEAKLEQSGLNLYNSDGHRELDPNEELGEITCSNLRLEYDLEKIYDFPGYNVPPPAGTQNDEYWSTNQQAFHSKTAMLQMLNLENADESYKRKKLIQLTKIKTDNVIESIPISLKSPNDKQNELATIHGDFSCNSRSSGELSDSLSSNSEELNTTCKSSQVSRIVSIDSSSAVKVKTTNNYFLQNLEDSHSFSNLKSPTINHKLDNENNSNSVPLNTLIKDSCDNIIKVGSIKSVELGTPLIGKISVYSKLPSSDKFSKDICDVINFENLPGTTGKYEKMNSIIQKIRSTLTPKTTSINLEEKAVSNISRI